MAGEDEGPAAATIAAQPVCARNPRAAGIGFAIGAEGYHLRAWSRRALLALQGAFEAGRERVGFRLIIIRSMEITCM
jgi:hypothetical protein